MYEQLDRVEWKDMDIEPSMEILLTCLSYDMQAPPLTETMRGLAPSTWQAVIELSDLHGVANLLHHRLEKAGVTPPTDQAEALKAAYFNTTARNMRVSHALAPLLSQLNIEKIPVIVFKGAHLAQLVYDQIGLRDMSDVDLLFHIEDLSRVEAILLNLGYLADNPNRNIWKANHHFTYHHADHGLMLEVHWLVFDPRERIAIDHAVIWQRAVTVSLSGQKAYVMTLADLIPYLCAHIANHWTFVSLRMLVDIAELVCKHDQQIDWQRMAKNIREWALERPCYLVFRLTQDLFGAKMPPGWPEAIKPDGFLEEIYTSAKEHVVGMTSNGLMLPTWPLSLLGQPIGLRKKLALGLKRFFPTRQSLSYRYPASPKSWRIYTYYPVRWVRLIKEYGQIAWQLLWHKPEARVLSDSTQAALKIREWMLPNGIDDDRMV